MSAEELTKTEAQPEAKTATQQRFVRPQYEVVSHDDKHLVRVMTPGASKQGVSITREKDSLLITAAREPHYQENWNAHSQEILEADYRLRLQLNVAIDDERIAARLENGVLEVALPVAEEAKPRQISIE